MNSSAQSAGERRGVVGVLVQQGRLLAIRRSQWVAAPGRICFPGGHIEPGEDPAAALCREWQEELGLCVRPLDWLWENVTPWGVRLSWWQVVPAAWPRESPALEISAEAADLRSAENSSPWPAFSPDEREVAEVLWLTADELLARPELLASNVEFLTLLRQGEVRLRD